ncbi:hypothetical protein ADENT20671_0928 [Actinomyces denticolens]|nr:hypothetical protein ADENT20671_0928 [Actinomyces denticolens]
MRRRLARVFETATETILGIRAERPSKGVGADFRLREDCASYFRPSAVMGFAGQRPALRFRRAFDGGG